MPLLWSLWRSFSDMPDSRLSSSFSLACLLHRALNSHWPQCRFSTRPGGELPARSAVISLIRIFTSLARADILTFSVARLSPCTILPRVTARPTASDSASVSNAISSLCCLVSLLVNSKRYGINVVVMPRPSEAILSSAYRRDSSSFVRNRTSIAIRQVASLELLEMGGPIARSPSGKMVSNVLSASWRIGLILRPIPFCINVASGRFCT